MSYRVSFLAESASLALLLGILEQGKGIKLEGITPIEQNKTVSLRGRTYHRMRGKRTSDVILELCKQKSLVTQEEIQAAFVKEGFAPTGVSPAISRAIERGLVVRNLTLNGIQLNKGGK